jgi:hypothetical protein
MDAGVVPPVKQAAPPKLDNAAVWQAFENDANRAGMTSSGNPTGMGVEDLLKEAEAKQGI